MNLLQEQYDPFEEARRLTAEGRAAEALAVLEAIPAELLSSPEAKAVVAVEKQACYLEGDKQSSPEQRASRFFCAEREFYTAIATLPRLHRAYHQQAEFWHQLGNDAMAARLLRSVERVAPHARTRELLRRYEGLSRELAEIAGDDTQQSLYDEDSLWSGTTKPHILIITHRHSDYGMDTLYDGLCELLGDDRVTEFPFKPFLHGQRKEDVGAYPCFFERRGEPKDAALIADELRAGRYDMILFADMLRDNDPTTVRMLMEAGRELPLFILDTWDDCGDHTPILRDLLGRERFDGYFKREMLACVEYAPGTYPLPFGYPDTRIPKQTSNERPDDLFWAGHRVFGLRRLYLEHLEGLLGARLDRTYTQEEYVQALGRARIGLNFFGFGFDTVRYYELPAHGCMLLSERPPIRIPHPFRDGESAVFFDDLPDLEEKLAYYLARPDEVARIAHEGRECLTLHHTTSVRARQLLGRIERILGW